MFSTEKALQDWLVRVLERSGVSCRAEVVTHPKALTRADIVTDGAVIECKKMLGRNEIYQAHTQANMYSIHLGKSERVLIGQPPFNQDEQKAAIAAARALATIDPNLSVYWVNQGGIFPVGEQRHSVIDKVISPAPARVAVEVLPDHYPDRRSDRVPVSAVERHPVIQKRTQESPIELWKLALGLGYVIAGVWMAGAVGAAIGLVGMIVMAVWV